MHQHAPPYRWRAHRVHPRVLSPLVDIKTNSHPELGCPQTALPDCSVLPACLPQPPCIAPPNPSNLPHTTRAPSFPQGFADDYAYTIAGLLDLYFADGEVKHLQVGAAQAGGQGGRPARIWAGP